MKDGETSREPPPEPRDDLPIEARERSAATRCPFCRAPLRRRDRVRRCTGCGARVHLGCLGEAGATGCPACGGTVFAEGGVRRLERRLRVDDQAARARTLAVPVGLITFLVSLLIACPTSGALVRTFEIRQAWAVLLMALWPLALALSSAVTMARALRPDVKAEEASGGDDA